jgi:hypothetical protein
MQHKTKSLPQQATYWLGVIAVGLTVGLGIQFAQAWTNPPAGAPDGNVAGPITTGGDQTKAGRLGLQGQSASSGYPNGWAGGLHAWDVFAEGTVGAGKTAAGGVRSYFNGGWAQFPGFSDADNGNYYADPAGWSVYRNFQTRDNNSWGYIALGEGGAYNSNPGSHVGSLHVNDIYLRSAGKWASDMRNIITITSGNVASCHSGPGRPCGDSVAYCPSGYRVVSGGHDWMGDYACSEKYRFTIVSRPEGYSGWRVRMACSHYIAYAICIKD